MEHGSGLSGRIDSLLRSPTSLDKRVRTLFKEKRAYLLNGCNYFLSLALKILGLEHKCYDRKVHKEEDSGRNPQGSRKEGDCLYRWAKTVRCYFLRSFKETFHGNGLFN